jgi:small-conductance mechanosensitive channel
MHIRARVTFSRVSDQSKDVWQQIAFWCYLGALAGLGFRWLAPLSELSSRAIWSDLLIAASAAALFVAALRSGSVPRIRAFHLALSLYVLAAVVSAAYAADQELAFENVLVVVELAALALLTSVFASDPRRLPAIGWTICFVSLYTAVLAAVGLALFYAADESSLVGAYGEGLIPSDAYARVRAGFYSAPLLGSFCIFASAVLAREDITLPSGLRLTSQLALAALVLASLSRAAIGFAVAVLIRAAYRHRHSPRVRVAAFVGVVTCLVVVTALSVGRLHLDPTRPETISYEVPDPHGRRQLLATSFDTLREHPVVGAGPGSLTGENISVPHRAHMTLLNIAATMGLPALAAFAFLIATLWANRRRPTPVATWSGMAGLGVDSLAQDVEHFRHVWAMIGFADADRKKDRSSARSPARDG